MATNPQHPDSSWLTRRQLLCTASATVAAAGLADVAGTRAEAAEKVPKDRVSYQDSPKDDLRCADCRFFQDGNQCERVEGEISPDGWCALWSPKPD